MIAVAIAFFAVTACTDYKKVSAVDAFVDSFGNLGLTDGKVSADVVISVVFDNVSGSEFSLKKGSANLYDGSGKLFATLTTGQSPVLKPHTKDTITFKCKAICYKPLAALSLGFASTTDIIKDDMKVSADLVATQGFLSKHLKFDNIQLKELTDKFTKTKKKK